jgi:hypothetical protein
MIALTAQSSLRLRVFISFYFSNLCAQGWIYGPGGHVDFRPGRAGRTGNFGNQLEGIHSVRVKKNAIRTLSLR